MILAPSTTPGSICMTVSFSAPTVRLADKRRGPAPAVDGRSPGLRLAAPPRLPGPLLSLGASGIWGIARRIQLRGQPRHRGGLQKDQPRPTVFPFTPPTP